VCALTLNTKPSLQAKAAAEVEAKAAAAAKAQAAADAAAKVTDNPHPIQGGDGAALAAARIWHIRTPPTLITCP